MKDKRALTNETIKKTDRSSQNELFLSILRTPRGHRNCIDPFFLREIGVWKTSQISRISRLAIICVLISCLPMVSTAQSFHNSDVVIFGSESVELEKEVHVSSGNVFVNEENGELNLDKDVVLSGSAWGDEIEIDKDSVVNGDVFFNNLDNDGVINGFLNTPLVVPIFMTSELPPFQMGTPGVSDIDVEEDDTVILAPGDYGSIFIEENGILIFDVQPDELGIYDIESLEAEKNTSILFNGSAEVRIFEILGTEKNTLIGPSSGSGIDASDIVFYIENMGDDDDDESTEIGKESDVAATFYAPNGEIIIKKETIITGALIAKEVVLEKGVEVNFESAFTNAPPVLDMIGNQSVDEGQTLNIGLSAIDPDADGLVFSTSTLPSFCTLTDNGDGTGSINCSPGFSDAGSSSITVTVTDDGTPNLNDEETFTLTVETNICDGVDCDDRNICTTDACDLADGSCESTDILECSDCLGITIVPDACLVSPFNTEGGRCERTINGNPGVSNFFFNQVDARNQWIRYDLGSSMTVNGLRYITDWFTKAADTWEVWATDDPADTPENGQATLVLAGEGGLVPQGGPRAEKWQRFVLPEFTARYFYFKILDTYHAGGQWVLYELTFCGP